MSTTTGGHVTFDRSSTLSLDIPTGRTGGRFESIQVKEGIFQGRTVDGRWVLAPLNAITSARVEEQNLMLPYLIVGGLVLSLLAVGLVATNAGRGQAVEGRPLRVEKNTDAIVATLASRTVTSEGWGDGAFEAASRPDTTSLSPKVRAALAVAWTQAALGEHASVPAFARLSLSLVAAGAPARLIETALQAAREEIGHAHLAFALASRYAGRPVLPGAFPELRRAPAVTATSYEELAMESLLDGCLMEGMAAAVAVEAGPRARDAAVRRALAVIARDEGAHAELAWDVVSWCFDRCGAELATRLRAELLRAPEPAPAWVPPRGLEDALAVEGWLGAAEWQRLFRRTREAVALRLEAVVAAKAAATSPDHTGPFIAEFGSAPFSD
jgi:hypothetical protein